MIRSSKPSSLVCPLATICGSKLPLRSRGIASSIAPSSPSTVLLEWPLRLLPLPRPARSPFSYPRCSLSSAPSARSSSFFLSSLKSPSSPSRSCGELYPCSSSSITSSLIARAMSVIPLLHRVHHGSNLHKISDTLVRPHPEQGFRACLGIVRLVRPFGADRLEAAATRAIEIGTLTYGSLRSILDNRLDRQAAHGRPADTVPVLHPNIRGSRYY